MSYNVIWSSQAEITAAQNMDYLAKDWDNKVQKQFLNDIENALVKIRQNPFLYPLNSPSQDIRKYKINKRIILYFRIANNDTIELMTFWNTWRNPEDLKF